MAPRTGPNHEHNVVGPAISTLDKPTGRPPRTMKRHLAIFVTVLVTAASAVAEQKTVTIATVNNPAMIELKKLSPKFEAANPDIKLNWVVVEENVLRQRVTTDVSTGSGQFD